MAEKIVYDIEMKGLESSKKNLEEITKAQYEQRNAIKETTTLLKAYEKALANLEEEVGKTGSATEEQVKQNKELNDAIQKTVIQLDDQKSSLTDLNKQKREQTTLLQAHNTVMDAEIGSNEQLRAQLKILTTDYDKMSQEERDNTVAGRELAAETLNITNKLKENEKAVGDNRRNVGNYEAAITSALGKVNVMGVNLGELTSSIRENVEAGKNLINTMIDQAIAAQAQAKGSQAMDAGQKGAASSSGLLTKALNFLKIGLVQTGIGAIVVALGLLVAGFLSTQRGADAVTRVLEPLKAIMSSLWGVVQNLGTAMIDAFTNPQKALSAVGDVIENQISKRIQAVKDLFMSIINLDFKSVGKNFLSAFTFNDEIKSGVKETKEFFNEAIKKGQQIASLQKQIEIGEINLIKLKDEYEDKESALLMITKDTSKSFKEREDAAKEIIKLTEEYSKEEEKILLLKIEQLKLQQKGTDQKRIDDKKMAEMQSELDNIQDMAENKRIENMYTLSGLKKEQNALIQEAINLEKDRLASISEINRTTNEQLKFELDEKLKLLKLNRDDDKLTKDELAAKTKLTQDYYAEVNQGETERINKLQEFIKLEDLTAQGKKQAALEELGLLKDVTEMTELEFAAYTKINEQYFEDLSKEHYDFIQTELERQKDYLTEDSLNLELKYLQDLRLAGDNAEEKERINKEYQENTLKAQKETIDAQMQIIASELENLEASLGSDIDFNILKEAEIEKLRLALVELGIEAEKIDALIKGMGKKEDGAVSLAERLGIDAENVEEIKAGYQAVVDGIQTILSVANDRVKANADERIATIDEALEKGLISEESAERKKDKIQKDALEKQKKIQKTQATINYFTGLINAIAQAMQYVFPANLVIGAASSAALTAVYAGNMKRIDAQKFEDGGLIQGPSHSKGGVPFTVKGRGGFEAEGGEFIQNKKAVQHYGTEFMQAINTMKIPKLFAEGGFVAPVASGSMSSQVRQGVGALAESITSQENRVILVETDLRKTQNKVNNVEAARTY